MLHFKLFFIHFFIADILVMKWIGRNLIDEIACPTYSPLPRRNIYRIHRVEMLISGIFAAQTLTSSPSQRASNRGK